MQGLVWGEPELAHEYDFDVENRSMHSVHPQSLWLLCDSLSLVLIICTVLVGTLHFGWLFGTYGLASL